MSNTKLNHGRYAIHNLQATLLTLILTFAVLITMFAPSAKAQSITLMPTNINLYVGANYNGVYTNFQVRAIVSNVNPNNPFTVSATAPPAGVTVTMSTNASAASATSSVTFSNTQVITLVVAVTNVTKGKYALTLTATTNAVTAGTTSFNLIAGALWSPAGVNTNWSNTANWTIGAVPGTDDAILSQDVGIVGQSSSNYMDSSITADSFIRLRGINSTNSTFLAPATTLTILGTNGFAIGVDSTTANNKVASLLEYFYGDNAGILVSNTSANFTVNADNTGNGPNNNGNFGTVTVNMTNLANLKADVNRFGIGDYSLIQQGGVGAQNVVVYLAKTNVITARYTGDYSVTNALTFALSAFNNGDTFNNGGQQGFYLGYSNAIFADSIAVGQARAGSGNNTLRFNNPFTNGNACYALFRNPAGGPVSLIGAGIDSGASAPGSNARGTMNFSGGTLDMLVDTLWLGRGRNSFPATNAAGTLATGTLTFGPGTVNVNTARLGYQPYTNNSAAQGTINVNSNGLLIANNMIELGFVTGDYTANGGAAAQCFGQLVVNGGGVIRANQIVVRPGSTNNQITLNAGSALLVTNSIGDGTTSLTKLTMNAGGLNLPVAAGVTNVYVTNLITAAGSKINILSVSGFASYPATNILIAYQVAADHSGLGIGTLPAGFNNMQIVDDTDSKTIQLRIATNAPAILRWVGGASSTWDHTSLNWQNTNTLAITRFFDGDKVIFDDKAGVPTTITVTETVLPGQSGTGIIVSNSINNFTFNDGGGAIGATSLVKAGTGSLSVNCSSLIAAQINQGSLTGTSGSVGSVAVASGASLNFAGTIGGTLTSAGVGILGSGGIVNGPVTIQTGGTFTNSGTLQGGNLTLDSSSSFYNTSAGSLLNIGSATVGTNATLVNDGNIGAALQVNNLTVNGTFKDTGVGSIYLTTLTVSVGATFLPGGDGIGITAILSPGVGSTFPGRVLLATGSTTLIKVDFANPQTNTIVKSQYQDFGPNTSTKSFDGCTILVTNINPGAGQFALGQTFRMFQNSDPGITSGNIGNEGLNTTNRYPIIQPVIPLANTKWDLSNLRDTDPNGFVNIISFPTTGTNLSYATFIADGTNQVSHLQWPSEYIGWSLQQQTNSLSVGISTNWTTVAGSSTNNDVYITNSVTTPTSFFRMTYP